MTKPTTFRFNGDYRDTQQVAAYLDAFSAVREQLEAAGQYPYNDSFKGRIAGLDPASDKDEDTAIYLLQGMYAVRAEQRRIAEYESSGYRDVVSLPVRTQFARLVLYRAKHYVGGTGIISTFENARLIPDANGKPYAVLPKGKRTRGYLVEGARVLAMAL